MLFYLLYEGQELRTWLGAASPSSRQLQQPQRSAVVSIMRSAFAFPGKRTGTGTTLNSNTCGSGPMGLRPNLPVGKFASVRTVD